MPDLDFQVEGAEAVPYAASPTLVLKLRLSSTPADARIHTVMLRCQIQIEAIRRRYAAQEHRKLFDLFGEPERWGRTLRTLHWTQTQLSVPGFTGSTTVDLPIACTGDADVAVSKYFDALDGGDVPLCLLFSGTVFHATERAPLQVAQLSWEKETKFQLPVDVWQNMMEHYYPGSRWIRVRKDLLERLTEYKRRSALLTWDEALQTLLEQSEVSQEEASSRV